MDNKLYSKDSIESLSPLEFTRLRPGVYAGDVTYSTQLLVEIVSNAVDEARLGHGDKINVSLGSDGIMVQDFGQGFLVEEYREDGKTILEAAFSVLNTSGKYREDGTYEGTSLGSFGIGSKITTFLSHKLSVLTVRDNRYELIDFIEGEFSSREVGDCPGRHSGTTVVWQPSEEFFINTEVEVPKVKALFQTICCLCPGLTINLKDYNGKNFQYYSENGLDDLVDTAVGGKEFIENRLVMNFVDGKYKMDLVMTYTDNYSSTIVPYVNTGLTSTGPHITQIKTALTRECNTFFRNKKWLKEKDENLSGDDIQEGMYMVFNITTSGVQYDAQVKSRVTQIDVAPIIKAFKQTLNAWFYANEKEVKLIADKAIGARKAREAAKKARDAARGLNKKKKEKALKFDSKLADCNAKGKDRLNCEIYITEGK